MTTETTEGISERQFYIIFAQKMLRILFSMDIGWGSKCDSWALSWMARYQAEQNTWLPAYLVSWLIPYCRCYVRPLICGFYEWQLTDEQIALYDQLNLNDDLLEKIFNAKRGEYIGIAVSYCAAFLLGTLGK